MEQSNPFDDAQGEFIILINARQQYSLWPQRCALPVGWNIVYGPQPQEACFRWLEEHWNMPGPEGFVDTGNQQ